jgi:hypothetical protein
MRIQVGLVEQNQLISSDVDGLIADGVFFSSSDIHHELIRLEKKREEDYKRFMASRKSEPDITWLRKFIN